MLVAVHHNLEVLLPIYGGIIMGKGDHASLGWYKYNEE